MKRIILTILIGLAALAAFAQQQVGDKRTHNIFAFPEFRDAKVLQPFGRFIKAKANIFLKTGTLCYMENEKVMEAYLQNVIGVEFDSIRYVKINDKQLGKVVSQKGHNQLLCLTTINETKLRAETDGGDNLPFLEITDAGAFFEIDGQAFEFNKGYPLTDKYYFRIKGTVIPANESSFKKYVRPEMKKAFKRLMNDKFWSWKDAESLTQLFTYLQE